MTEENNDLNIQSTSASAVQQPTVSAAPQQPTPASQQPTSTVQQPASSVQQPVQAPAVKQAAPTVQQAPIVQQPAPAPTVQQSATSFVKPASPTVTIPPAGEAATPNMQATKVNYDNNFAADFNLPPKVLQTKFILMFAGALLVLGGLLGCVMSPSEQKVQQSGLGDVVVNPYFKEHPVRRCGQVEADKACVLYIMNAKSYDQLGRDFFVQAANITGVPEYTIRINNVSYSEKLIRPGFITQIYIPSRR